MHARGRSRRRGQRSWYRRPVRASDEELVAAWRRGEREAGERLFRRYFAPVLRFFRNKVDDGLDDLVQQTFAACLEGRHRLRGDASFRSYVFAVAHRVFIDHLRRKYRLADEVDLETTSVHDLAPGPSTVVRTRREQQLLIDALRRLPVKYQVVLEMYFWEEMKGRELAEALEVPLATVQGRLVRARELLSDALDAAATARGEAPLRPLVFEEWAVQVRADLAGSTA